MRSRNHKHNKNFYNGLEHIWNFFQRLEQKIIRLVILSACILIIVQYVKFKDPVELYLAMAENVESPAIEVNGHLEENEPYYTVRMKAEPAAPVKIIQNGQIVASLGKGEVNIPLSLDQFILDARGINETVRVQILEVSPAATKPAANQIVILEGNAVRLKISP